MTKHTDFPGFATQQDRCDQVKQRRFYNLSTVAPVRLSFLKDTKDAGKTPLSEIIGGRKSGQGGGFRLKLYLTLLWLAERPDNDPDTRWQTNKTKRWFAEMLGVADTKDHGQDRVAHAIHWLDDKGLIERVPYSTTIYLLDDAGTKQHYVRPGQATNIGPDGTASIDPDDYYFKIPGSLWFDARIVELDSAELVAYLALLSKLDFRGAPTHHPLDREWVWWAESEWDERIHLSRDTRYNGFNGLVKKGIVAKESERVHGFDYDPKLRRRKYALIDPTLDGRS